MNYYIKKNLNELKKYLWLSSEYINNDLWKLMKKKDFYINSNAPVEWFLEYEDVKDSYHSYVEYNYLNGCEKYYFLYTVLNCPGEMSNAYISMLLDSLGCKLYSEYYFDAFEKIVSVYNCYIYRKDKKKNMIQKICDLIVLGQILYPELIDVAPKELAFNIIEKRCLLEQEIVFEDILDFYKEIYKPEENDELIINELHRVLNGKENLVGKRDYILNVKELEYYKENAICETCGVLKDFNDSVIGKKIEKITHLTFNHVFNKESGIYDDQEYRDDYEFEEYLLIKFLNKNDVEEFVKNFPEIYLEKHKKEKQTGFRSLNISLNKSGHDLWYTAFINKNRFNNIDILLNELIKEDIIFIIHATEMDTSYMKYHFFKYYLGDKVKDVNEKFKENLINDYFNAFGTIENFIFTYANMSLKLPYNKIEIQNMKRFGIEVQFEYDGAHMYIN